MRIYQAGPLFSQADINWHRSLTQRLSEAGYDVVWPGDLVTDADVAGWGSDAPQRIFAIDKAAIDGADLLVALLDGAQVDDGTAWEMGYAHARGKAVIGIRTDFRRAGETGHSVVNAMLEGSCHTIVRDIDALLATLDADFPA